MKTETLVASVLLIIGFSGWANADAFKDPDMSMDAGSFSTPLSQFTSFMADANGGGILDLFNDTGQLLTSFGLTTYIIPGLNNSTGAVTGAFGCNSAGNPTLPNPFFLSCGITYNASNGALTINFFGVNPWNGNPGNEIGEHQGIPSLAPGCNDSNADSPACAGQGHFSISLNDNFSFITDSGGWSPTSNPNLFDSTPSFTLATPEPSGVLLLLTGVLAIGGIGKARRGRAARRRTSN